MVMFNVGKPHTWRSIFPLSWCILNLWFDLKIYLYHASKIELLLENTAGVNWTVISCVGTDGDDVPMQTYTFTSFSPQERKNETLVHSITELQRKVWWSSVFPRVPIAPSLT